MCESGLRYNLTETLHNAEPRIHTFKAQLQYSPVIILKSKRTVNVFGDSESNPFSGKTEAGPSPSDNSSGDLTEAGLV